MQKTGVVAKVRHVHGGIVFIGMGWDQYDRDRALKIALADLRSRLPRDCRRPLVCVRCVNEDLERPWELWIPVY